MKMKIKKLINILILLIFSMFSLTLCSWKMNQIESAGSTPTVSIKTITQPFFYRFLFRQHIDELNVFSLPIQRNFEDQSVYIQDQNYPEVVHPFTFTDFDFKNAIVDAESRQYEKNRIVNTVNEIRIADYYQDYFDVLLKEFLNISNYQLELNFLCGANSQELIQMNQEEITSYIADTHANCIFYLYMLVEKDSYPDESLQHLADRIAQESVWMFSDFPHTSVIVNLAETEDLLPTTSLPITIQFLQNQYSDTVTGVQHGLPEIE